MFSGRALDEWLAPGSSRNPQARESPPSAGVEEQSSQALLGPRARPALSELETSTPQAALRKESLLCLGPVELFGDPYHRPSGGVHNHSQRVKRPQRCPDGAS